MKTAIQSCSVTLRELLRQALITDRIELPALPLRLHYRVAPIVSHETRPQAPELEQHILGRVLQVFNDLGSLRGSALLADLAGQSLEIFMRLEPLTLEEITRVWDALDLSYQLCISYEVSVIPIASGRTACDEPPVDALLTEPGVTSLPEAVP